MASACGKVILFGEHAAVYGHPALAVGIPDGVRTERVTPTDGPITIRVEPWGLRADTAGPGAVGRGLIMLDELVPGDRRGMHAELRAAIPPGAGLGSSAALSVALVRSLGRVRRAGLTDRDVRRLAHALEEVFHGQPSGLDDTVATYGGLCLFRRGGIDGPPESTHERLTDQALRLPFGLPPLVIGHTGVPRSTADMVAVVRRQHDADRSRVEALFARVDACLAEGLAALRDRDPTGLGRAMSRNQAVLAELGLSCPEIDSLIGLAAHLGASGAKLTGAGGGGGVVALAPGREEALAEAWREAGFAAQVVRFAEPGLAGTA